MVCGLALLASGQAMAVTITSANNGDWNLGATWTGSTVPPGSADASIGHIISTPPGTGPFTINSVLFTASGMLNITSGNTLTVTTTLDAANGSVSLNSGGTLTVNGNVTVGTGGTINTTNGTLNIGGALDNTVGTFTPVGTLGLTDADHTITLAAGKTFGAMNASSLTGGTGAGKTITFIGAFDNIIASLALPATAAKEIKFVVPASQKLTISAMTGNTMTCTGGTVTGTAAAPVLNAGTGNTTFTCTTGAGGGGGTVSAPIFDLKPAQVFATEVEQ